jgi:hypothetical protein
VDGLHPYLPADALAPDRGVVRKFATFIPGLTAADYTTLFRRIHCLDLSLNVTPEPLAEDVIIAVDSIGIKVTNRGEWMREK